MKKILILMLLILKMGNPIQAQDLTEDELVFLQDLKHFEDTLKTNELRIQNDNDTLNSLDSLYCKESELKALLKECQSNPTSIENRKKFTDAIEMHVLDQDLTLWFRFDSIMQEIHQKIQLNEKKMRKKEEKEQLYKEFFRLLERKEQYFTTRQRNPEELKVLYQDLQEIVEEFRRITTQ